jgi:hypothetical protein
MTPVGWLIAFLILAFPTGCGPTHAQTAVPNPTLTPGAVRTTDSAEICTTGTRQLRQWDRRRDDRIMAEYGCRLDRIRTSRWII